MLAGDWDTCTKMANEQVREGAHVLDVCVDYVGRDGARRHGRDRQALRHPGQRAARDGLHRVPGAGGRPAAHRRAGDPQLGEPRGRRAAGQPLRQGDDARPRLRRGRHLPPHRRARPGPRRRVEDGGRPPHPRHRHRALRPVGVRPHLRRPDVPAVDGRRGPAQGRHVHDGGDPADQGRDPRRPHHARRVQRQLRPQPGRPPRPEQRVPPRVRAGRPRLGDRPRRQDRPAQPAARRPARGLPRPRLRPPHRHLRPAAAAARGVRRRQVDEGREGRPQRAAGAGAPPPPHHRRRPRRPDRRPRRGARRPASPRWTSSTTSCSAA